jgi:hypothetical protein
VLLAQHCRFMDARVELEGEVLSRGMRLPRAIGVVDREGRDGIRGCAGFSLELGESPQVHLLVDEVLVWSRAFAQGPRHFHAVVRCDALELDLSRADVVQGELFHELMALVSEAAGAATQELARAFGGSTEPGAMKAWTPRAIRTALEVYRYQWAHIRSSDPSAIRRAVTQVRRWKSVVVQAPSGLDRRKRLVIAKSVSLAQIARGRSGGLHPGYLAGADVSASGEVESQPGTRYLVLDSAGDIALMKAIFGESFGPVTLRYS